MKYLAYLSIILLFSCSKVGPTATNVKGQVIDVITGNPIEGINIIISGENTVVGGDVDRHVTVTDENGNFDYRFSAKIGKFYDCKIDFNTPNIVVSAGNTVEEIIEGEENIFEFETTFGGYLKETYIDLECDPEISLLVKIQASISSFDREVTRDSCETYNPDLFDFILRPMGSRIYTWQTIKNGEVLAENRDSIFLEIGERREFIIEW